MNCLFCKIINNEINSYTIYEDEIVKVFLDVNPRHNGHTLIIPKKHYKDFYEIDEDTLNYILKVAKDIASLLTKKLNCDGISLIQNNGISQEIKHFHLHVVPQYKKEDKISVEEIYNQIKEN